MPSLAYHTARRPTVQDMTFFFPPTPYPQMYLSYNNVSALKLMDARSNWVLASEKHKVRIITWHVRVIAVTCLGFLP